MAAPLLARLGPIFGLTVPSMLLMMVWVGAPSNIPYKPSFGGQFGALMRGICHGIIPPLHLYKEATPSSFNNTSRKRALHI